MKRITAFLAILTSFSTLAAFAGTPDLASCNSWSPAASCNYTVASRPSTYSINYVVIHKGEGTASGGVSWFQNCASGGSAHFFYDNNTGYCWQCVYEKDVAWHAGNWTTNCHSVGIEHGGYTANNDTKTICYDHSALETKSCIQYYSVTWDRSHIIPHSSVPQGPGGHTDPGAYWNWTYYMSKCNPSPPPPPPSGKDYIIDNTNGGFSCSANWATGTSSTDKYGASYRYHSAAAVSDLANFSASVAGGSYTISAWWPQGTNRSTVAPFTLPTGTVVKVNQQVNGGKWNTLGTASLAAGARVTKLSCWTTTGFIIVADAVKYYGP